MARPWEERNERFPLRQRPLSPNRSAKLANRIGPLPLTLIESAFREPVTKTRTQQTATAHPADPGGHDQIRPSELEIGQLLDQRFEILECLGRGGSSTVYRVLDRELGQEVALKRLHSAQASQNSLDRLRREARIARQLSSPHLVRVFDVEFASEAPYLLLELVSGESLAQQISNGPLTVDRAVEIASQIALALAELHGAGILHRDVKPANILLTEDGRMAKLADFGLALPTSQEVTRLTATGALLGTMEYLAPEQALGQEATERSDLYALGLVIFEMLTQQLPFSARTSLGTLVGRISKRPPRLRRFRPDVPPWLDAVLFRLLSRHPSQRYATAQDLLGDLRHQRPTRPPLRSRVPRIAAQALAAVLVAAAAGSLWHYRQTRFSHLIPTEEGGVVALSRGGAELWRDPNIDPAPYSALARLQRWKPRRLVGMEFDPEGTPGPEIYRNPRVLDLQSGHELPEETIELADGSDWFPKLTLQFKHEIDAVDLNGDGLDELIITYQHTPEYPGYVVLWEPATRRHRVILVTSGHHYFAGSQDLDDDGRAELLFLGTNNPLGYHNTLTGLKLDPPVGEAPPEGFPVSPFVSPDLIEVPWQAGGSWYELLPPGTCYTRQRSCLEIDADRRRLIVGRTEKIYLSFDGLRLGGEDTTDATTRRRQRDGAWNAMREGKLARMHDQPENAVVAFGTGSELAARAGSGDLARWLALEQTISLIEAGDFAEARNHLEALLKDPEQVGDAPYRAAQTFYLHDQPEIAFDLYRTALERVSAFPNLGNRAWEYALELLLVGVDLGRADEVLTELENYVERSAIRDAVLPYGRVYARWRAGEPISLSELELEQRDSDIWRYWALEFGLTAGADPRELLTAATDLETTASATGPLLAALKAQLLAELDGNGAAVQAVTDAFDQAFLERDRSVLVRSHFDIVARRYREITGNPVPDLPRPARTGAASDSALDE